MGGLVQYLKDTRQELRHVAWPTQTQTIVYTLLVAAISLGVAAYLGLFDFLFTTGVSQIVNNLPAAGAATQAQPIATSSPITITPGTTTVVNTTTK
jgi:preprotein translocase SecE subunit